MVTEPCASRRRSKGAAAFGYSAAYSSELFLSTGEIVVNTASSRLLRHWGALVLAPTLLATIPAQAQPAGCTSAAHYAPARSVITCPDGLTITVEDGAAFRLLDRDGNGTPDSAELAGRGVLIEVPQGRRTRFQIYTPHAIASVRGTVWATDVGPDRTSVFVARGAVAVRPQAARQSALLQAGDGVDVAATTTVPEVKRWGAQRAAALLARFGR